MDSFDEWMKRVDEACRRLSGVSIYDLQDEDFRAMHDDEYTPVAAARAALTEAGF